MRIWGTVQRTPAPLRSRSLAGSPETARGGEQCGVKGPAVFAPSTKTTPAHPGRLSQSRTLWIQDPPSYNIPDTHTRARGPTSYNITHTHTHTHTTHTPHTHTHTHTAGPRPRYPSLSLDNKLKILSPAPKPTALPRPCPPLCAPPPGRSPAPYLV